MLLATLLAVCLLSTLGSAAPTLNSTIPSTDLSTRDDTIFPWCIYQKNKGSFSFAVIIPHDMEKYDSEHPGRNFLKKLREDYFFIINGQHCHYDAVEEGSACVTFNALKAPRMVWNAEDAYEYSTNRELKVHCTEVKENCVCPASYNRDTTCRM